MLRTILFDLDGTLLPMDTDEFTRQYFKALAIKLKDYFTPEDLIEKIWTSTNCMIRSLDSEKSNEEIFFEDFYSRVDHREEVLNPMFNEFYEKDFDNLKKGFKENKYMVDSIELLKEKNYNLVVATNPLFPKIAILHRIKWAGLDEEDFKFITSFEEMHYCKPNIEFFEEIIGKIDEDPQKCMMVGNDVVEDMKAKEIGISTYLIKDNIIGDANNNKNIDYMGEYRDFYNFCRELPDLN